VSEYPHVEKPFLDQLSALGWTAIDQGQGFIPSDPAASLRDGFREWILPRVFREAVRSINLTSDGKPWLTDQQLDDLRDQILRQPNRTLLEANEAAQALFLKSQVDHNEVTGEADPVVKLIDFRHPERNQFHAINQFRIDTPGCVKSCIIPDIVLFVNGIPLVVVEAKIGDPNTANPLHAAFEQLLSVRAISRRLKIARKTVRKVLDGDRTAKMSTVAPRPRLLLPYDGAIRQVLSDTPQMRAPAMLERLRTLGYRGGITIVRERLRQLRPHAEKEPFLTLDFKPGAAAQVDWADFGFALPGCPRRVSAFVMVMCYSRMLYLEFTLSQAMGSFLRCMERALRFFGGSTTVDIFDNMKTVVLSHTPLATVFNPTFLAYARARQFGAIVLALT